MHYYRAGSAASRLAPAALDDPALAGARLLHLSGITPALSASCRALVEPRVDRPAAGGALVSFDVNHRARLWPAEQAAPVLRDLADRCRRGLRRAWTRRETLWGITDPQAVRGCCPTRRWWWSRTARSAPPRWPHRAGRSSSPRCGCRWSSRSAPATPSPPATCPGCCAASTLRRLRLGHLSRSQALDQQRRQRPGPAVGLVRETASRPSRGLVAARSDRRAARDLSWSVSDRASIHRPTATGWSGHDHSTTSTPSSAPPG